MDFFIDGQHVQSVPIQGLDALAKPHNPYTWPPPEGLPLLLKLNIAIPARDTWKDWGGTLKNGHALRTPITWPLKMEVKYVRYFVPAAAPPHQPPFPPTPPPPPPQSPLPPAPPPQTPPPPPPTCLSYCGKTAGWDLHCSWRRLCGGCTPCEIASPPASPPPPNRPLPPLAPPQRVLPSHPQPPPPPPPLLSRTTQHSSPPPPPAPLLVERHGSSTHQSTSTSRADSILQAMLTMKDTEALSLFVAGLCIAVAFAGALIMLYCCFCRRSRRRVRTTSLSTRRVQPQRRAGRYSRLAPSRAAPEEDFESPRFSQSMIDWIE